MSGAALKVSASPVPVIDVFQLRCEARAVLVESCAIDLHDAVDEMQEAAVASGLVDDIGHDAVQKMMAEAVAIVPRGENSPPKPSNVNDYAIADLADGKNSAPRRGAAFSTIKAAEYLVQQKKPGAARRLAGQA